MLHQEQKYRVDSFTEVQAFFQAQQIELSPVKTTEHYYARQPGDDVVKLVSYQDKHEIHELEAQQGSFVLRRSLAVVDAAAGLAWLRAQGYEWVDLVKMTSRDYAYQGGLVRLYLLDDWLHSVILDYPAGQHQVVAEELGLSEKQLISAPYNKYLQELGKLRTMRLAT